MGSFQSLQEMLVRTAEAVRPPERLSVWEAAEKYRIVNNPGSYVGPYDISITPYMKEPMEVLSSLEHTGMIFVGPAQCGKSDVSSNWLTYSAICDPADYMHVDKSQTAARDFYNRRVERLYRDTKELRNRLLPGQKGTSTFTSKFISGMLFTLSWPTVNELSGKPVGRIWLADYDRMDEDIGGEGSAYDLAVNRTKTFGKFAMTAAESSPSRDIENPKWMPKSKHEAPPTTGILALYNRGDRRRFLWTCDGCGHGFEPDFSNMQYDQRAATIMDKAESVFMVCPHCGTVYNENTDPKTGVPGRNAMNQRAAERGWVADGQWIDPETGEIVGTPARSKIASFWLKGPAAFKQNWSEMMFKYLSAMEEFENTGSEEALKTTTNTDQALPYLPVGMEASRLPEELKARAKDLGEKVVPEGVRFLIATVDVQPTRFECQITGFGLDGDVWIIDRFKIRKSERRDDEGDRKPMNTASYVEDWMLLIDQVILKTYPLADGSGEMQIKFTGVDSGGKEGTTKTAADFWRYLRDVEGRGLHARCHLLKGEPRESAPLVKIDYPDAERKDRKSGMRGDVPVVFISSNKGKDMANVMLGREEPGGGYVNFPDWLEDWYFVELTAETRTAKGWVNTAKAQNESWDLLYYALGIAHSHKVGLPRIHWDAPPSWADAWEKNDLVMRDGVRRFDRSDDTKSSLADLAGKLA